MVQEHLVPRLGAPQACMALGSREDHLPPQEVALGRGAAGGGGGDGVGGRWRVGWAFPREVSLFLTLLLYGPLWTPSKAICSKGSGPAVSDIRGQPASWRPSNILPTCSALSVKSLILSLPGFFPGQGAGGAGGGKPRFLTGK